MAAALGIGFLIGWSRQPFKKDSKYPLGSPLSVFVKLPFFTGIFRG